jgi:hypothetical protein
VIEAHCGPENSPTHGLGSPDLPNIRLDGTSPPFFRQAHGWNEHPQGRAQRSDCPHPTDVLASLH